MSLERCPICKVKVKAENLPRHVRRVHPVSKVQVPSGKRMRGRFPRGTGGRRVVYAVVAVVILVAGSLLAYSMTSGGSPEISVSPPNYDFGSITQREVSTTVQVRNDGDSDLVIEGISTSCGCTSAVLRVGGRSSPTFGMHDNPSGWSETLLPNQAALLDITYDATLHPDNGPVLRIVYIKSNDPARPEVEVELTANVVP
jgi:hypothetical protein